MIKYNEDFCMAGATESQGKVNGLAGQIQKMIQTVITQKAKGNMVIANSIRTKMYLKGIAVDKFTAASPDDPAVMQKIREIAKEFGVLV